MHQKIGDVVVEREETEGIVADSGDLVGFLRFGYNLQAAMESVEAGEVGLGAEDENGRRIVEKGGGGAVGRAGIGEAGDRDSGMGQVVENEQTVVAFAGVESLELGTHKHLHLEVLIVLNGLAEGTDIGMGHSGEYGNFLAAVEHFDGDGAAVVGLGGLVVERREGDGVGLEAGAVGSERERKGDGEGVVGVGDRLTDEGGTVVGDGEGGAGAFETYSAEGDLEGELIAEIGNAIVAYVGNGGIAAGGGVAKGNRIDRHSERGGCERGVDALIVDAVAGQHHGAEVAAHVAVGNGRESGRDVGGGTAKGVEHHIVI